MRKSNLLFVFAIFLCSVSFGQKPIRYGSNNGKYVSITGTKIYYEEYGKGAPLILLQGGLGSIADFSLCIPFLSKHFRVIAPDQPGQGRSAMTDSISYQLLADYVSRMIDALKLDSAYVMGWSDGGNAALILTSNRPDKIKKVLASGANYKLSGYIFSDSSSLKPIPADYEPAPDQKKWIDETFIANKSNWKKILNGRINMWRQELYFSPEILNEIKVPAMIVMGDHDGVTLEHGIEMHRLIPKSQLCVLPNTSHYVFAEKPDLINRVALDFFIPVKQKQAVARH